MSSIKKQPTKTVQWALLISLLIMTGFLAYSTVQTAQRSTQKIVLEQEMHIQELHHNLLEIEGKINTLDLLMLPIYQDHIMTTNEKLAVIESLRSLEGSAISLTQLISRFDNDSSRYLSIENNEKVANDFHRAQQAVLHSKRLARIADTLLLQKWVNYEQQGILVEHFNATRWSLEMALTDPS